jgi:pimeloyl-ACP methyl ester carboxylesterase
VTSRDADELRRALGIAKWDVYGVSYGTSVARDLLAGYPASVGSVVLDSPVTGHAVSATGEERTDWTMRNLFAACAADSACARAHPDFESRFLETFDSVDARHLLVPIPDAKIAGVTVADINGAELDFLVRRLRRNVQTMGSIPRIMEAARKRDVDALTPLVTTALANVGMGEAPGRPSIACRDGAFFHTPSIPRTSLQMTTTLFCPVWGPPGPEPRMPTAGSSPVLVLVGGLDMLIEQSFLEDLTRALKKQMRIIVFPALGHATMSSPCAKRIGAAFYTDPRAAVDTTCVEPRPRIVFDP